MIKVYLVIEDNYVYGVFSTWNKAYSWIRKELRANTQELNLRQFYNSHPRDLGSYEIYDYVVDARYGDNL